MSKNTYFFTKWLLISGSVVLVGLLVIAFLIQPGFAQDPQPSEELQPGSETEGNSDVSSYIPIQGRLTNSNGVPLNGDYSITFSLYTVASGGTAKCFDTRDVTVTNGLFSTQIANCDSDTLNGQLLYLGIKVGSDPEMTPRQLIYAIPYAWSLKPGAVISSTRDTVLTVRSTGTGDADALMAYGGGDGEAITGYAQGGVGVAAFSENYLAIQGYSNAPTASKRPAIFGCSAPQTTCDPFRDDNDTGVMGYSRYGFGGYFVSSSSGDGGVYAESNGIAEPAVYAHNMGNGVGALIQTNSSGSGNATLYLVQENSGGDFVVGASSYLGTRYWRVDRTGTGYFNGGTVNSGADFAEQMAVEGEESDYEPGDVLVISTSGDRMVELSTQPFSTAVIGVYSTQPAVLAGAPNTDDPLAGIPVAITGIVPCKVSAENGPIQRGDLLVTSSIPGHAMRAGEDPPQGTVLGKALGELNEGRGVIFVLVMLQ